jgi:hypothetical protein
MESLQNYINEKQNHINHIIDYANKHDIDINIKINDNITDYIKLIATELNLKYHNIINRNSIIIESIKLEFEIKNSNNLLACLLNIYILNYHILCSVSKSKHLLVKTINISNLTINDIIEYIGEIMSNNKIYCNCNSN